MTHEIAWGAWEIMSLIALEHKMGPGEGGEGAQRPQGQSIVFCFRKSRNASQRRKNMNYDLKVEKMSPGI